MTAPVAWLRPRLSSPAALALALAVAIVAAVAAQRSLGAHTTNASGSVAAHAVDLIAGFSLIAAGFLAWGDGSGPKVLAPLAGAAWFASDLEGWDGGPALVRSIGALASPLFIALGFHLVAASPRGQLEKIPRLLVLGSYGVAGAATLGLALFRDPYLDPTCWRNCTENSFLLDARPGFASALDRLVQRSILGTGLVLVGVCLWTLWRAPATRRRLLSIVFVPGALVGGAYSAYAIELMRRPLEDPRSATSLSLYYARALTVTALALGAALVVVGRRRVRAAVRRLVEELGDAPEPGTLETRLRAGLKDPTLEVVYPLSATSRYVDTSGQTRAKPSSGNGRIVTPIVRNGEPVALVVHDAAQTGRDGVADAIGAAARLAVDNERLRAEVLAQLEDIRGSRSRIVETADAERRRLERNLHDGAQQRLLALLYELRLARSSASAEVAEDLDAALWEAQTALDDLRDLAHGIHPAVLQEAGLAAALETLADTTSIPLELTDLPAARYSASIETAAYTTVVTAVEDAVARGATAVFAAIEDDTDRLIVVVSDDGVEHSSYPVQVADRVEALGGRIHVGPKLIRAEIPCES